MTQSTRHIATSVVLACVSSHALASISIYQQGPLPPAGSWGGAASLYDPGSSANTHTADGFALTSAASLSSVRFWGRYVWSGHPQPAAFRVTIWNADGTDVNGLTGSPGSVLFAQTFAVAGPGFIHTPYVGPLTGSDQYDIDLGAAVPLAANTRYWISFAGIGSLNDLPWAWAHSTTGQHLAGEYNVFSTDSWWTYQGSTGPATGRAFELFEVPAPHAAFTMIVGSLLAARRRRSPSLPVR